MKQLRPCDCIDTYHANLLNEQGIGMNDYSISTNGNVVTIEVGSNTTVKLNRKTMKIFAEWFLRPQEITGEKENRIFRESIDEKEDNTKASKRTY